MKKVVLCGLVLMLVLCMAACAAAEQKPAANEAEPVTADVMPLPTDPAGVDPENGWFAACLEDTDRIDEKGWFTLALYLTDAYDREQVEHLMPGMTVLVNGQKYTVAEKPEPRHIGPYDEEMIVWDIDTEEECWGGLWFMKYGENTFAAYLDDWIPCTLVARVRVMLPLPDRFVLYLDPGGEERVSCTAEEFLTMLRENDWGEYNQYNSDVCIENGEVVVLSVAGYPHGPQTDEVNDEE